MTAELIVDEGRTAFRPNERLSGTARWTGPRKPESARLQLFYYTNGSGTRDVVVHATTTFDSPCPDDDRPFEFFLPASPWSFVGRLVSLHWTLELILDCPPRDDLTRLELEVSPKGGVIDLYDHRDVPAKPTVWQEFWRRYTG